MVHRPYQSVKTLYWRTFHRFMGTFVRDFPTFVSGSSWSSTAPAAAQETVQQRWNPLSERAITTALRQTMPFPVRWLTELLGYASAAC